MSSRASSDNPVHPSQLANTGQGHALGEGANVARRGRPSKAERQIRRGKSMGRYPLKAAVEKYLEIRGLEVGSSTLANERRILRHIAEKLEAMREKHQIKTTHPRDIGPAEIRAFLDWMRDSKAHGGKALDPDTQVRYLSKLEGVLKLNGNHAIERMKAKGVNFPQKVGRKPIRAISSPDLSAIQKAALLIGSSTGEPKGWRRAKARFLMVIYVATGLRP